MLTDSTSFVEVTGVFGAGYVPKLLQSLQARVEDNLCLVTGKAVREFNCLSCVDNSLAMKSDASRHARIDDLIQRGDVLSATEVDELIRGLHWADELVSAFVQQDERPIDLVFRRGGTLQAFALLGNRSWQKINASRKHQPKLPIFLTAPLSVIQQTWTDREFRTAYDRTPYAYCRTPQDAYDLQAEWWRNLKPLETTVKVERFSTRKDELLSALMEILVKGLSFHGVTVVPRRRAFICHASEDKPKARELAAGLKSSGVNIWLDEWEIKVGDSIVQKIDDGISDATHLILLLSKSSCQKPWVQKEFSVALMRQLSNKSISVLPVLLEDCAIPTILTDIRYADCRDSVELGIAQLRGALFHNN